MGVGMVVDNANIVIENIFRYRQLGKPFKEAIITGTGDGLFGRTYWIRLLFPLAEGDRGYRRTTPSVRIRRSIGSRCAGPDHLECFSLSSDFDAWNPEFYSPIYHDCV